MRVTEAFQLLHRKAVCMCVRQTDRVCVQLDRDVDEGLKVSVKVWPSV